MGKKVIASVTATDTEDGVDVGIGEGISEVAEAIFSGGGEVRRVFAVSVGGGDDLKSAGLEVSDAVGDAVWLGAAGGRYECDARVGRERTGLEDGARFSQGRPRQCR